jgi:23S rRNA U2552 (ribose-2'-O)-methylase RlmE/FtsJ
MEKQDTPKPPWEQVFFQKTPASIDIQPTPWVESWFEQEHSSLTDLKQSISPFEENKTWETIKKISNSYELIYTNEAPHFPPSLAMVKPLSRSFFKMVEMLEISQFFQTLPKQMNGIRSAHVAEGPGGFIEALSDRCSLYKKNLQKAFAITLKPNGSNVPGWKRAHTFLQRHPEVLIHYGRDGTGDIYHLENQTSFLELCSGRVHVFTADGGFDFSEDYATQEKNVYPLLLASCKIGLQALLPGGLFVMKLFDVFGKPTQYLLRLITSCFREWFLYKPATSRPCNSERYLVCRGFRRCPPAVLTQLAHMEDKIQEGLYPDLSGSIPWTPEEAEYLQSHIQSFTTIQCDTIKNSFYYKDIPLSKFDWNHHIHQAHSWCSAFRVPCNLQVSTNLYKSFGYKTPF